MIEVTSTCERELELREPLIESGLYRRALWDSAARWHRFRLAHKVWYTDTINTQTHIVLGEILQKSSDTVCTQTHTTTHM